MREILFRGKRTDNGEWVEGLPAHGLKLNISAIDAVIDKTYIAEYYIDPSTVCQYTGLTDKNGKKIWENDIVQFEDCGEDGYEYKEGYDFTNIARVVFEEGRWQLSDFLDENSGVLEEMYDHADFMLLWETVEVIGNIFDNPDLLNT